MFVKSIRTLILGVLTLQLANAGVDPLEFSDEVSEASSVLAPETSISEVKIPLIIDTQRTKSEADQDKVALVNNLNKTKIERSSTGGPAIQFENRFFKGMMICNGECPVDPDEFRNTRVSIDAFSGMPLIDLIRSTLPVNWTVRISNVDPKKLIEKYSMLTDNDTREKVLIELQNSSDLSFQFFHQNFDDSGSHSPIMVVKPGRSN